MKCALCLYGYDKSVESVMVVDGYSLCSDHAYDVVNRADYIWRYTDERFSLIGTVKALRGVAT